MKKIFKVTLVFILYQTLVYLLACAWYDTFDITQWNKVVDRIVINTTYYKDMLGYSIVAIFGVVVYCTILLAEIIED